MQMCMHFCTDVENNNFSTKIVSQKLSDYLSNLQATIKSSWDCHTFARLSSACRYRSDQTVEFLAFLFQLLHKTIDCQLCE